MALRTLSIDALPVPRIRRTYADVVRCCVIEDMQGVDGLENRMEDVDAIARALFQQIETDVTDAPDVPVAKLERVSVELLYLSIFLIDFGVYVAWQDAPVRRQVMDEFWNLVGDSGLNTEVVNARVQAYAEAAKGETQDDTFDRLGRTFAWHCLARDDAQIARFGATSARRMLASIVQGTRNYCIKNN